MSENRPRPRLLPTLRWGCISPIGRFATLLILVPLIALGGEDRAKTAAARTRSAKEALARFNALIGGWRGTGQPRRGSAVGSWLEKAEWVWDFTQPTPAIRYDVTGGKILKSLRISPGEKQGFFQGSATLADGTMRLYEGRLDDDRLVLESRPVAAGDIHRLTITLLNEKRTIVLFERRRAKVTALSRVAEVGYTREGTRLAVEGQDGPECVVTGGKGTIAISYKGKTYHVCCSGCKQAFEENPEKILAEYRQRIEDRAKGK